MARTTGASELLLVIDRRCGLPLRDQIVRELRAGIVAGHLRPGAALPASRILAGNLGVSRGVVVEAYADLREQGYLTIGRGRAPRVAALTGRSAGSEAPEPTHRFDLALETPDVSLFPRRDWLRALTTAIARAPDRAFDYGDPLGTWELRSALADYLGRTRGVVTTPECVVVCQGSIQAIDLTCRIAAARGVRSIALEDPCADGLRTAARFAGLNAFPVSVDEHGIRVSELASSNADSVVVTPSHQFPSGVPLSSERRVELLAWAHKCGGLIVEDDYDSEFHFDRPPWPALHGSAPDHIVYVGSVSKTLAPAVRIGWAVIPRRHIASARAIKSALDGGSPAPEQFALAQMMTNATFERHIRHARAQYSKRRDAMIGAVAELLAGAAIRPGSAGLHVCVILPSAVDRRALERATGRERIRVRTLESFLDSPPNTVTTLLVGFGRVPVPAIAPAIAALARCVEVARRGG